MSNERAESYRQYASLCQVMADETIDPTRKKLLGEMAHFWKALEREAGDRQRRTRGG